MIIIILKKMSSRPYEKYIILILQISYYFRTIISVLSINISYNLYSNTSKFFLPSISKSGNENEGPFSKLANPGTSFCETGV